MRRTLVALLALALGATGCGSTEPEPLADEGWRRLPASPLTSAEPFGMSAYAADAFHIWMERGDGFVGAAYLPFDDVWVDLPDLTGGDTAVASDDQVFIWGWSREETRFIAATFDPVAGELTALPQADLPVTTGAVVATTDTELIIWGGALHLDDVGLAVGPQNVGAAYDWGAGTWRTLAPSPLEPRAHALSVWTGSELVIWGGTGGVGVGPRSDGAAYDPATDTWRRMTEAPLDAQAYDSTVVWTGTEMIVWGGLLFPSGGAGYDPATDSWRVIADAPGPNRRGHAAVWTGTEMIVYGGSAENDDAVSVSTTWFYDPATDSWTEIASPRIEERFEPEYAWNGIELLVWGGFVWEGILGEYGGYEANGYAYIP